MARLLYIEASPRKKRSSSINIARKFIEEYSTLHPDDEVAELDLWKGELPRFDGPVIDAKYAILHGGEPSAEQKRGWKAVEDIIEDFNSADRYLFSLPMWNFGIPYKLKHYIDILVQPGYTFSFSADEGYKGLVTGKPAVLIYARGGSYRPGTETEDLDYQKTYMELVLGFIGFTDIRSVVIEPTLMVTPEEKAALIASAQGEAKKIAASF